MAILYFIFLFSAGGSNDPLPSSPPKLRLWKKCGSGIANVVVFLKWLLPRTAVLEEGEGVGLLGRGILSTTTPVIVYDKEIIVNLLLSSTLLLFVIVHLITVTVMSIMSAAVRVTFNYIVVLFIS